MNLSDRFRLFADFEVKHDSPLYAALSLRIAEDDQLLDMLEPFDQVLRQPQLFLSAVNLLGGLDENYGTFRSFVLDRRDGVLEIVHSKRTQTNEVGRCASLLPVVCQIEGPVSLIEVGASAGLNLFMDRFAYDYGEGRTVGDSPVVLRCETRGPVPVPDRLPEVVWRKGIDRAPIDVCDAEAVKWLEACVFPGRPERLDALHGAVAIARAEPPQIVHGDLEEEIEGVLAEAPADATTVVFHSAVLAYCDVGKRKRFADLVRRPGVVWLSNESPSVVESLRWTKRGPSELCFFLGRNGTELLAYTHPHGRWIDWLDES